MADNIHPVVELLVARMESHPEEFEPNGGGRWAEWLDRLIPFVTEEERVMLRGHMMQEIHEEVMDELLNGDERRAEEQRRIKEAEMRRAQQMQGQLQQANAMLQSQQAATLGSTSGIYLNNLQNSVTSTQLQVQSGNMRLGDETLDAGMLKQIKKKLGL